MFKQDEGVHLICVPVPQPIAQYCYDIGVALRSSLPHSSIYVNTMESMHITLYHTARPDDHKPTGTLICRREIDQWHELVSDVDRIKLELQHVCVAPTGAVLALYREINGHIIDNLRQVHNVILR